VNAPQPFRLTSLEVACGLVFGPGEATPEPFIDQSITPLAAFEEAVLKALERPPCLVSFSGGRDSSAVLGVAARVARREGLPLPIPATNRFPSVALSNEVEWQELVVAHLGLHDWFRNDVDDELDSVGPVAAGVLRRHGLLWPFNTFFHQPLLQEASGGSLLTGIGGDEVFGISQWARARAVVSGTERPRPRDALRVGLALAPPRLRARVFRRRLDVQYPWLRPGSLRRVLDASAAEDATEPFGWGKSFHWWRSLRYWQVAQRSLDVLAAASDARIVHPFASSEFLAALARLPKETRFGNRSAAMGMLVGDVLPASVIGRRSKASFDGAFFNVHSRRLAATWNGEGVDPAHVDPAALRDHWSGPAPEAHSFLLLQAAWLARESGTFALLGSAVRS
jgi:hypothetical protein